MRRIPAVRIFRLAKRQGIVASEEPAVGNYGFGFHFPPDTSQADRDAFLSAFRRAFNEDLRKHQWCWDCGAELTADAPPLRSHGGHSKAELTRQFKRVSFRCAWCFQIYCARCAAEHFGDDEKQTGKCEQRARQKTLDKLKRGKAPPKSMT